MKQFWLASISLVSLLTSQTLITQAINNEELSGGNLMYTCYQLDCLWHALYGPGNPLKPYIQTYQNAITTLAQKQRKYRGSSLTDMAQLTIAALQEQLEAVQAHATTLLNQFQLTTSAPTPELNNTLLLPPPNTYTAAPLPGITPAATDTALQQVFSALQQLQQHQTFSQNAAESSSFKEHLIFFGIGVLFLASATLAIKYKITGNMRRLQQTLNPLNQAYMNPCTDKNRKEKRCGMLATLGCGIEHLTQKGTTP